MILCVSRLPANVVHLILPILFLSVFNHCGPFPPTENQTSLYYDGVKLKRAAWGFCTPFVWCHDSGGRASPKYLRFNWPVTGDKERRKYEAGPQLEFRRRLVVKLGQG
jgi:hypothetical protein